MGQRRVPDDKPAQPEPQAPEQNAPVVQVEASRIIARLRQQRADLQAQLDFAEEALVESQIRESNMMARIVELEEREEKG